MKAPVRIPALLAAALVAPAVAKLPPEADPAGVPHGIRVYGPERVAYRRGPERLRVDFGAPVAVAVADKPRPWGFFQFPTIARADDGTIRVDWNMAPDAAAGYGAGTGIAVSRGGAQPWTRVTDAPPAGGVALSSGGHLQTDLPKAVPASSLNLPAPVGVIRQTYGGVEQTMYRLADLPDAVSGVPLKRRAPGADAWTTERGDLRDPDALRYAIQGLFPVIWLGDMKVLPDGSVVAGVYPGYRLRPDGAMDTKNAAFFYRSTDNGRRWDIQGRIPYQPDLTADAKGLERAGFTEPATERLQDGSLLCVLRTTDGLGVGPMYAARSTDDGRTWSRPEAFSRNGVLPRLLQLENGVLVLSSGRPGVQVRFSGDGGRHWAEPYEMLPWEGDAYQASCGYTGLLATGPDTFLIVYSDFQYPTPRGRRKAIMTRAVRVSRAGGTKPAIPRRNP